MLKALERVFAFQDLLMKRLSILVCLCVGCGIFVWVFLCLLVEGFNKQRFQKLERVGNAQKGGEEGLLSLSGYIFVHLQIK